MPAFLTTIRQSMSSPGRWLATLESRIVLLAVLTGLLSAAGTAMVVLHSAQKSIRQMVLESASAERATTARLLGSKVAVVRDLLSAVATQIPAQAWRDAASMGNLLQERAALAGVFRAMYAADLQGQGLARVDGDRIALGGPNIADRAYFRQAMASNRPVVSDALWGRVLHAPVVMVATRVNDAQGQTIGVLTGVIALGSTALFERSSSSRVSDTSTQDLVIDRAGRLLAHPDASRVMSPAADDPVLRSLLSNATAAGTAGLREGIATVQGDHVVSMAAIPNTDWISVHLSPLDATMAPVAAAQRAALPAALGAGLAAGLLAGVLGYALTGPLTQLRRRTESLLVDDGLQQPWPEDRGEVGALTHALRNVMEQRARRQDEAQALLQRLQAVLDHADVGIALTRNGQLELVSRQFCHIFRCDPQAAIGQSTRMFYPDDKSYETLAENARRVLNGPGVIDVEVQMARQDGQIFWARMRGRAVVPGDMAQGTIWTFEDVTTARAQREQLTWSASHDALTGLLNRAAFERLLETAVNGAAQQPFCALFIDLDHFKQVNDTAGHAAGDALLRDIAGLLAAELRKTDVVARMGGDEFAVLLPACPPARALTLADALCSAVQQHALHWEGQRFNVGASVGLVAVDGCHDARFASAADVLRAADVACYRAKKRGRSRVEMFEATGFELEGA